MPFAHANGIDLYYEQAGEGERLLFISGTGADLRRSPRLTDAPGFARFELLAYDQRGLGQSAVPEGPYTMAQSADDAAGLLGEVGWDGCLVLGVSFGGMVAQELAIRHPGLVRRLALACTSAGGAGGASYPLHELLGLDAATSLDLRFRLLDTRWDAAWRADNPETVTMIAQGLQLGETADGPGEGPVLQLEARRHHDTSARLAQIGCPTLVCCGRYDGLAPPANSEFLAAGIPDASSRCSRAATSSSCRTRPPSRRCSTSWEPRRTRGDGPGRAVDSSHGPHRDTRVEGTDGALREDLRPPSA